MVVVGDASHGAAATDVGCPVSCCGEARSSADEDAPALAGGIAKTVVCTGASEAFCCFLSRFLRREVKQDRKPLRGAEERLMVQKMRDRRSIDSDFWCNKPRESQAKLSFVRSLVAMLCKISPSLRLKCRQAQERKAACPQAEPRHDAGF